MRNIVITGASEGIGRQIALKLAQEPNELILIARNKEKLKTVAEEIEKIGKAIALVEPTDLSQPEEIAALAANLGKEFGMIDGLINDAGIWQKTGQLDTIPSSVIHDVLQTNLIGLINVTKELLPLLRKSSQASIINIVSRSGYMAQEGQSVYTASKFGVKGFTEVLRQDLKSTSIRVAAIYQGGTNTDMFRKAGESIPEEKYASFIPPEGIADVVSYMLHLPPNVWLPEVKIETK